MSLIHFRIRGRLIAGFVAVGVVLAAAVGYTVHTVSAVSVLVDRIVEVRTPVALGSAELIGEVYSTLAILRGYLQNASVRPPISGLTADESAELAVCISGWEAGDE